MKQVIYEGSSAKCLILNVNYYDGDPVSRNEICLAYFKHILDTHDIETHGDNHFMRDNATPILVDTKEYHDGDKTIWGHHYIFVYKLPQNLVSSIYQMFSRYGNRTLPETIGQFPAPALLQVQVMTGATRFRSIYYLRSSELMSRDDSIRLLSKISTEEPLEKDKVLGFESKEGRKKYYDNCRGWHSTNAIYDLTVSLCSNVAESINGNTHWLWSTYITSTRGTVGAVNGLYDNTPYAVIKNRSLIFADSEKSLKEIEPTLTSAITDRHTHIIINHYGMLRFKNDNNQLLFIGNEGGINNFSTLVLYLINKKNILGVDPRNGYRPDRIDQYVSCKAGNKNRKFRLQNLITPVNIGGFNNAYYYMVLPYDKEKNTHISAIETLRLWQATNNNDFRDTLHHKYTYELLLDTAEVKDDIMSEWFKACTINAQSDEERLKAAYHNLKNGLVEEYRQISLYLAHHNMNNKKPIPSVSLGKGFEHNPQNKFNINQQSCTYREINYRRLEHPFTTTDTFIKYLIPSNNKRKMFMQGEIKLADVYDKQKNNIKLDCDLMTQKLIERMR